MAAELSPADRLLIAAVSQADVMDAAGRLIANPRRAVVSLAEQVAMARAVEQLQAVAIEAELLVNALNALPETEIDASLSDVAHEIWLRVIGVNVALKNARGETNTDKQETDDGEGQG